MFIKNILLSVYAYLKSFKYLFSLWKYVLLLIFLIIVFSFPVYITDSFFKLLMPYFPYFKLEEYERDFIFMMSSLSGFVLLLILSPVFSMVSEEIFHKLSGTVYRFSFLQLIKDIIRGIKITIRNLIFEYLFLMGLALLVFILPDYKIITVFAWVLNMLVTSYFFGFTLLDYAMENQRMSYKQSVEFVRNHPGLAIGLGLIYFLMIHLNDLPQIRQMFGEYELYWTGFGEALVAFLGVIAGSIVLYKIIQNKEKEEADF